MELLPLLILHPPVTGYYASSKGYSFWTWFFIGLFLPIIANIILYFLKAKPVELGEIILHEHEPKNKRTSHSLINEMLNVLAFASLKAA
jgi:hypothetical protein